MNGIERIKDRILEEARQEADRIIEEAEDRARELKEKKATEAGQLKRRLTEENERKAQEKKKRMLTVAQLEMRKNVLAVKQEMIDKVMDSVLETIQNMPRDKYRRAVGAMILESVKSGDEEIVFSTQDVDRLDADFLNGVNIKLREQGRKGELKLSPQREDFSGGFILRSGGMEINNSFESILRIARDELEPQIAEILFDEA